MINIKVKNQVNMESIRKIAMVLLVMYIMLTVYKAFLSPERLLFREGLILRKMEEGYFSRELINIRPLSTIVNYFNNYEAFGFWYWFINVWGNILFFLPYGFLCPIIFEKIRNSKLAFIFALVLPVTIEVFQEVLSLGIFDIDDIILNFIGIAIGCFFFNRIFRKTPFLDED